MPPYSKQWLFLTFYAVMPILGSSEAHAFVLGRPDFVPAPDAGAPPVTVILDEPGGFVTLPYGTTAVTGAGVPFVMPFTVSAGFGIPFDMITPFPVGFGIPFDMSITLPVGFGIPFDMSITLPVGHGIPFDMNITLTAGIVVMPVTTPNPFAVMFLNDPFILMPNPLTVMPPNDPLSLTPSAPGLANPGVKLLMDVTSVTFSTDFAPLPPVLGFAATLASISAPPATGIVMMALAALHRIRNRTRDA